DASAAFLPASSFVFIHDKAVHANAQIGSQPAFLRIKIVEQLPFQQFRKKALREILGRIGRTVPAPAHVFIDGLPVGRAKRLQCTLALFSLDAAYRLDYGSARGRETIPTGLEVFLGHVTSSFLTG